MNKEKLKKALDLLTEADSILKKEFSSLSNSGRQVVGGFSPEMMEKMARGEFNPMDEQPTITHSDEEVVISDIVDGVSNAIGQLKDLI